MKSSIEILEYFLHKKYVNISKWQMKMKCVHFIDMFQ